MVNAALSSQIAATASNYDIGDFLDGQRDCNEGVPHKPGMSESYDAGYSAEYQLQEIEGAQ